MVASFAVVCLIISSSLFFGFYVGSYRENVEFNDKYTQDTCFVTTSSTTNQSCYVISEPSHFMPSCKGTSCFDRILQHTSGRCCSDSYRNSRIQTQVIAWGTCYSVFATFQVDLLNYTFTENVNDCPIDDKHCPEVVVSNYKVGSTHACWIPINQDESFRATAIDPYKPTKGPLVGIIIGGLMLLSIGIGLTLVRCCKYQHLAKKYK